MNFAIDYYYDIDVKSYCDTLQKSLDLKKYNRYNKVVFITLIIDY